ncbi:PD-(D/E)XK nuclease family protein [Lignipirellula cremea]|uniref:ATP-dependent helicase/deoxyribonuclease subunit B n=1 Tax=Lignipirellula cremea TaxID=2528010 RepID=A0A518DUW5_9BACT|nr:PD-(D/E)XK nuclease family protein [Lignipirellula cremea]QDU95618.1 ATP-dependent helicase/deoxyribonuclease subunit B [Lignipirellula cremea]
MPIQRVFLELDRPALHAAATYLTRQFLKNELIDLSGVIVITPSARAGRRLIELLIQSAEDQHLRLLPPEIDTIGSLPERLYHPRLPLAGELVQQFAWAKSLRMMDRDALRPLIPEPPEERDLARWRDLGELIRRQHVDLAADGLDFADVAQTLEQESPAEAARWQALHQAQQRYHRLLDAEEVWDAQSARLQAIRDKECTTDRRIVLLAVADMNRAMKQMLEQVADQVTTLVYAWEAWADRFDEFGCLEPTAWETPHLPIRTDQVLLAENAASQVEQTVHRIASWEGRYAAEEITIGAPDTALVQRLESQFEQYGLPVRFGPGRPLAELGPYRLLAAVGDFLERERFADFAALVRHPDVSAWIDRQGAEEETPDWLPAVDDYFNEHLPLRLGDAWLGEEAAHERIQAVYSLLQEATQELRGDEEERVRRLDQWTAPLTHLLLRIYEGREFDRSVPADRWTLLSCERIHRSLLDHQNMPASLAPSMTAAEAIRLTLSELSGERLAEPNDSAAIEIVGWLDLPLDDAPALIVTSFNEPFVPRSVAGDLFLPNTLRSELGLDDNLRRYARDAYAVSVLAGSQRDLTYIVARRDSEGSPLLPTRLLFAADDETVVQRALAFFQPQPPTPRQPLAGRLTGPLEHPNFPIPQPDPSRWHNRALSPTAFRTYISCPYRFYLKHVLRLSPASDEAEELDGGMFGTLAHAVLEKFGESDMRDSCNADQITEMLRQYLVECAADLVGEHPLTPVAVQIEQLRSRLDVYAQVQADWAAQGWRILHTEVPGLQQPMQFDVDGTPQRIHGYIDRIDQHQTTGELAILDYKTSDAGKSPEKVHRKSSGEWIDLQLPLYRHLAQSIGLHGPFRMAYILLPKDTRNIGFSWAEWTAGELETADETAREVIRNIRAGKFWPPTDPPPDFSEDFAAICQDNVFDRWQEVQS